ncbi:Hypothetical_protein [Hexamita inflata]|uniref:Hypothetical_protein n=1 Tax=Hexamita inflata TaxID=28002 RepID=A0AA86QSS8_9EUKA|nr:Hypothetical protein HINF_LOCUS47752 [Hexamita inflata]
MTKILLATGFWVLTRTNGSSFPTQCKTKKERKRLKIDWKSQKLALTKVRFCGILRYKTRRVFCLNIARRESAGLRVFSRFFSTFLRVFSRMSSLQCKMYVVYKQTWSTGHDNAIIIVIILENRNKGYRGLTGQPLPQAQIMHMCAQKPMPCYAA